MKDRPVLLKAMLKEMEKQAPFLENDPVETIYFGGGTPSLLDEDELNLLMNALYMHFHIAANAEVTLEANPDDLQGNKLRILAGSGINRLSIGVQTFSDDILRRLNRAHSARMASDCLDSARKAGFDNVTVDLMYGLPGQSVDSWKADLEKYLSYDLNHLSAYSLTIEPKTVFGHRSQKGMLVLPDEDLQIRQFRELMEVMNRAGFEHYEISNFARPGYRSRHNTAYWTGHKYLGLGPSAHSYNGSERRWNTANNAVYVKQVKEGLPVFETEMLNPAVRFNEYIMTSLRTIWGISHKKVEEDFGQEFRTHLVNSSSKYVESGFLLLQGDILVLSEKGKFVADKITADLFLV